MCAALRILVFASAFPFFHPIDEHQHLDSVLRYARGELPGPALGSLDPRVARWAAGYGSFEYLNESDPPPAPLLLREGVGWSSPEIRLAFQQYAGVENTEHDSPPVYYALAGAWFALLDAAGVPDLDLMYAVRWLNALALAALVWIAAVAVRRVAPTDRLLQVGVPALLAFFPQDLFYGVTSDALSPLTGGLAFLALARLVAAPGGPTRDFTLAGLALATAFLTKYTNAAYFGLAAGITAWLWWRALPRNEPRPLRGVLALWSAALLPVAVWFLRNRAVLGDWTGTTRKVAHLEWSARPLGTWLEHPIFTPSGFAGYAVELSATFWRGEFQWQAQPLHFAWLDPLYAGLSLGSVALVGFALLRGRRGGWDAARRVELLALCAVIAGVATLCALSLRFEFADWGTPTRDAPFFHHGRLIAGVLLPFAWVCVRGFAALWPARRQWLPLALWLAWLVLVFASEIALSLPAFDSPANWFHAPRL